MRAALHLHCIFMAQVAEITNVSYRTDSAIAPNRRSIAAEPVDPPFVLFYLGSCTVLSRFGSALGPTRKVGRVLFTHRTTALTSHDHRPGQSNSNGKATCMAEENFYSYNGILFIERPFYLSKDHSIFRKTFSLHNISMIRAG